MSSRELRIRITAATDSFMSEIGKAQQRLSDFDKALQQQEDRRRAIDQLGNAFGVVGLAAAAAGTVAVKSFADFDSAMSAVKATGDDAAGSIDRLRQAALDAGAETAYSATESAAAIENLAKAGISATDILGGGLDGALSLAAAGGLDVASAAEIAAVAMTQFGLKGSEIPHVADLLAAAAGKANGEVTDMGQALGQVGLVAGQMGLSIEETTGVLAAFAQAGLLGSDAGTSFKAALQRLANPSKESADLMKQFGIEAYNASGELVSMTELAGQLETAFAGQSQATRDAAMAQIFGSDAIRAANVLYSEGASGIASWTEQVNDAGYAADTAATRMDNLKGDLELLMGSLETAFIGTGEGANGPLRKLVQNLTSVVDVYGELPGPIQESTLKMLGLTTAIGGTVFAGSRLVTGFSELANWSRDLGGRTDELTGKTEGLTRGQLALRGGLAAAGLAITSFSGAIGESSNELGVLAQILGPAATGAAFGPWGLAIGAAGGVASVFASQSAEAATQQRQLQLAAQAVTATLDEQTGAFTSATTAMIRNSLAESGALTGASKIGTTPGDVLAAAQGDAAALERVADAARSYWAVAENSAKGFDDTVRAMSDLGTVLSPLNTTIDEIANKRSEISATNIAVYQQAGAFGDLAFRLAEAAGSTDEYALALDEIPEDVRTRVLAEGAAASLQDVNLLAETYNLTPDQVRTLLAVDDFASPVILNNQSLLSILNDTSAAPDTYLNDYASGPLSGVLGTLNNLNGKSATVTVYGRLAGALAGPGGGQALTNLGLMADGGVMDYFANGGFVEPMSWARAAFDRAERFAGGGFSENHVAQIAPAGAWRVWAEPETGGEAYIPLAQSKRQRSLDIWAETGRRLNVQGFANGGIVGGSAQPAPVVNVQGATTGELDYLANQTVRAAAAITNGAISDYDYKQSVKTMYLSREG